VHGLLLDGQDLVSFERNALYQETARTQANGLLQTMKYDPLGRLIEQQLGPIAQAGRKDQGGMQALIVRRYRYDPAGQLINLEDSRRGPVDYRYDPVGRLLAANSALGHETFAFDPAGNIQAADSVQQEPMTRRDPLPKLPKLLDNLLKEYAGARYRYDDRGNLIERIHDGKRSEYAWDAFNRMTRATTWHGVTTFAYDPLGRRIAKHSQAMEGPALRETARTMYGWDGDTLALESSVHRGHAADERTVHYMYERDSFVPLVQATRNRALRLAPTTDVKALMAGNGGKYDIALDPLWNGEFEQEAEPFGKDEIAFYQCDHLGTPQELTDCEGKVAWSAQYKAWGQAKEAISEAAHKAGMRNPIRFQGQYFDEETGLHYNRHRYYDPETARYLTQDPIGLNGGENLYRYAPNPTAWMDPLGLTTCPGFPIKNNSARNLLKGRGLSKQQQHEVINSFDGQIYASHGRAGEQFVITESDAGAASGVFVTRCSAGATSAERRQKLALPPNNTAEFESPVALTRNQMLLEGKVAPQLQWGPDKTGGGWQVVTAGGKYTGAVKR
jgi:RHS repeat-associated protein